MFNFKIFLYCIQYINNNIYFCSLEEKVFIPLNIELNSLDNMSINDYIFNLLDDHIGTKSKYIKPIILDIHKDTHTVNIYYVCIFPLDTKLVNGYYIPYNIVSLDPFVQKAILYV